MTPYKSRESFLRGTGHIRVCRGRAFLGCTRLVVVFLGQEHPKAGKNALGRSKCGKIKV